MQKLHQGRSAAAERLYYGVVGNGETAALIGPDLAVRWLCLPRFDGTPFFASALDPRRGGELTIELEHGRGEPGLARLTPGRVRVEQEYLGRTNVLSTGVVADDVRLQAVDAMPWRRPLLVRRVSVTNTGPEPEAFRLKFHLEPVRSAHWSFAVQENEDAAFLTVAEKAAALAVGWVAGAGEGAAGPAEAIAGPTVGTPAAEAGPAAGPQRLTTPVLAPGQRFDAILLLAYGPDAAAAAARWREAAAGLQAAPPGDPEGLEREKRFWADWLARARFPQGVSPELEEAYARSLLTLKLLTHEESGAILAAATASFPAVPGGTDNWDYRYCWLRDGYYSARTYDEAGLHTEARAFYEFALRCQAPDGRWHQPLYTLDGGGPVELVIEDLAGPGGEKPVRFGNAAYDQLQIDNEPSVLHGLWIHAQKTRDREWFAARWDAIRRAADAMMELWHRPENGIWEIRERRDHWVYGKALCAAGFRAAAELADWLGYPAHAERWRAEADAVARQVIENGWCPEREAYLQTYDKNSPLDISALALVLWDLLPADDQRIVKTVAAFERPLKLPEASAAGSAPAAGPAPGARTGPGAGPAPDEPPTDDPFWGMHHLKGGLRMNGAFARYDYAAEPFYLPTLWMARYYLRAGHLQRARELVRVCLDNATSLGLMAEHFNPRTGRQWGNFPQAFSHEELALTILELAAAGDAGG